MDAKLKFTVGSKSFFDGMDGYQPKDVDELWIMDKFPFKSDIMRLSFTAGTQDIFLCRDMNKDEFIQEALTKNVPMKIGKFLVPEFANYLGITMEDLLTLKPLIDKIDEKHEYERIIYDSYIENNSFTLTEEQKQRAYESYKNKRS